MQCKIAAAIALRKEKKYAEAEKILLDLLSEDSENPDLNYQLASTYDVQGREAEAVAPYEKAIRLGLATDHEGAMLGLGSTYRCLGLYEKSLAMFNQAIAEFPENRALKVFRALTLYNLGSAEESVGQLLIQLLDTTSDKSIQSYERALRFYSDKLIETWK